MPGTKTFTLNLILAAGTLGTACAQEYFPLDAGNRWVYRALTAGHTETLTIEVTSEKATANGNEYAVVRGWPGKSPIWMRRDGHRVIAYNPEDRSEGVWWDFGATTGTRWPTTVDECSPTAAIESREAEYKGPVGEFNTALKIIYPPAGCADAGITDEAFLASVGMVRRAYSTIAGPRVYHLIYARLGSSTVIEEGALGFTLALDQAEYKPGAAMTVRMSLRNTTGQAVTLRFPSGQVYDLIIRDSTGTSVYTWSANRAFPQVFQEMPVTGETIWSEAIPLSALPAGEYTIEGFLTTEGEKRYTAKTGFTIKAP